MALTLGAEKSSVAESFDGTETLETTMDNQSMVSVDSAITLRERLPNSRSLLVIPSNLLAPVMYASDLIVNSTLVENAFPTAVELTAWVDKAWKMAYRESGEKMEECTAVCRREVSLRIVLPLVSAITNS